MRVAAVVLFICGAGGVVAAEPKTATWPLWDGHEPVEQYAARTGVPPTRTLDLGGGVTLEMVLVPPGRFPMGTAMPEPPTGNVVACQFAAAIGVLLLAVFTLPVLYRWARRRQRFQFSLGRLVLVTLAAGVCLGGVVRWAVAEQELRQYEAASRQLREALIGEAPAHWVTITRPFYMATCEVTQEQYAQVMNANPSLFKGPKLPVETVTWHDAQAFCVTVTLSTDYELRLPTEAEWEYACRGGPVGHEVSAAELAQYAWHKDTSGGRTQSAGQLKPNALELHDMLGNIWEWCQDTVADYSTAEQTDPLQTERPGGYEMRAIRGGSWYNDAACSRSAKRAGAVPDMKLEYIGFRVVMETAANMQ